MTKAREMKEAKKINPAWTVDEKIFVNRLEESSPVRIREAWELEELEHSAT